MCDSTLVLLRKFVQLGSGVDLHALLAEARFHGSGQILVTGGEDMRAALDEFYLGTDPLEELGQFDGDGTAAGAFCVECEASIVLLLAPILGKIAKQLCFALENRREVCLDFDCCQAEFSRAVEVGGYFGRAQDRLTGHAAAQDAQTSPGTVVDDGDIGPGFVRGARCSVSGRAAADDCDIVFDGCHS